jgi:hypothetical protein
MDDPRLAAITDYPRSIKTVQLLEMMPFIQLQNHHLRASSPVIRKRMSSLANARRARQEGQPHTSTLVRLSPLLPSHRLALRSHIGHQPEENGTKVADLLDELEDLMEQQKHISSKVDDVVSRLQEVLKQSTHRSLAKSGKLVRWADGASAYGPDDDTRRPRKRARGGS